MLNTYFQLFSIDSDAPKGWLLADLKYEKLTTDHEQLEIQPTSEFANYFEILNNFSIFSNKKFFQQNFGNITQLFLLEILATRPFFKRIIIVKGEIKNRY